MSASATQGAYKR